MATASIDMFPRTGTAEIDGLLSGAYWNLGAGRTITWALGDSAHYYWMPISVPVMQAAFDAWERVIDVNFVYKGIYPMYERAPADIVATVNDNRIFQYVGGTSTAGLGLWPNSASADGFVSQFGATPNSYPNPEGDIAFNLSNTLFDWVNLGSAAFHVALHEIGHAIGLKHPHDGGLAGYPTYNALGISHLDDGNLTLMSYDETSNIWQHGWSATPLPLDIMAAQRIYGANPTTHAGDTVHYLYDDGLLQTIYDVSGNDTLNASNITISGVTLNLSSGSESTLGLLSTVFTSGRNGNGTQIENAVGTIWGDSIYGNQYNNLLKGGGGNDSMNGAAGLDVAQYSSHKSNFIITGTNPRPDGETYFNWTVTDIHGTEGRDTVSNIERLSFSDVNVALDTTANPGEAYRIYKAAFDRAPDLVGLGFWINALDNGHSALEMASGFTNSPEFISLYGANNSNDDYLNLLYNNVLDRDGDLGGHAFWLGHLDAGTVTREKLLIDFSESIENKANVIDLIANGIDYMPYGTDLILV